MDDAERAADMTRLSILRTTASALDECLKSDALDPNIPDDNHTIERVRMARTSLSMRAEKLHARLQHA